MRPSVRSSLLHDPPSCVSRSLPLNVMLNLLFSFSAAITGSLYAPAYQTCSVIDSPAPYIQYPLYNKLTDINNLEDAYINATQAVIPVFILEMPPVNSSGTSEQSSPEVNLVCLHPSNISSGSETPPALPSAGSGVLGRDAARGAGVAFLGLLGAAIAMVL